ETPPTYLEIPVIDFDANPLPSPGSYATTAEYEAAFDAWVAANGVNAGSVTVPSPVAGQVVAAQVRAQCSAFDDVTLISQFVSMTWYEEPGDVFPNYDTAVFVETEWDGTPLIQNLGVVTAGDLDVSDITPYPNPLYWFAE